MKIINHRILAIFLCALLMIGLFAVNTKATGLLSIGSRGDQVLQVQQYLFQLNYLRTRPTGYFGKLTKEAVKVFQIEHQLKVDGVVGPVTMDALLEVVSGRDRMAEYTIHNPNPNSRSRKGGIQAIAWSIVNQLWRNGEIARIIDLETGKSFQAKRLYGYYHADVEPLTKEDTKTMKEIYGGQWSWERRAVVVQLRNLYIAASINGMPHGGESIYNNDFQGQFCAHFLGSRVHQTGRMDPDHHLKIEQAIDSALFSSNILGPEEFIPVITESVEKKLLLPNF